MDLATRHLRFLLSTALVMFCAVSLSGQNILKVTTTSLPQGTQNVAYSATLTASGGVTPYTWSIASGSLPAGLSLIALTGKINGTPTGTGTSNFTVKVTDSHGTTATKALSITVYAQLTITTNTLPTGMQNTAYSATLTASGGDGSYTWSLASGTLPAGLSLSSAGVISGTPTSTGTSNFTVQVTDGHSNTATKALSITIYATLTITTSSLPAGTQNSTYSATLTASGGDGSYTWSLASGTLPAGLSLSSAGVISGTPTTPGTSNFTVQVTDGHSNSVTKALSITIYAALTVTTSSLPAGTQNVSYSASLAASGGSGSYSWSLASGTLPTGLSLSSGGVISGTPTGTGTSNLTVQVTDTVTNNTATKALSITIYTAVTITTTSLPAGTQSVSYSATLSASGGSGNYSWSLSSGTLPTGLSLSTGGVISGIPTGTGTSNFTVQVTDTVTNNTATKALSLTVYTALSITTTSLPAGTQNASYSASLSATGGSGSYSWSLTSGSLPTGLSLSSGGVISGAPTGTGTSNFTVQVTDTITNNTATQALSITIYATLSITTNSLPAGTQNVAYSTTLNASGGSGSYSWSLASGTLPTGLSLNASTGAISGTPTATGTNSFTAQVTDTITSNTATASLSITIYSSLVITTSSLPAGTQNVAYSAMLTASGGSGSYTWSLTSGSLPAGLSLNASTGAISGTPTGTGTNSFTVQVTDSNLNTATKPLSISISAGGSQSLTYAYDALGRLVGAVDQLGNATLYQYDAVGNLLSVTPYTTGQPVILYFSPLQGPVGTTVTISGANFGTTVGQNQVSFNGTQATILSASSTSIQASVPAGATNGPITVTTPNGPATSRGSFVVTSSVGAPEITSISPSIVSAGTPVVLAGSNFDPNPSNDHVFVNLSGLIAASQASPSQLTFTSPQNTGSGKVQLATPGGITTSPQDLFIVPQPYTPSQVSVASRLTPGQPTSVPISTAGNIGMLLVDGVPGEHLVVTSTNSTYPYPLCKFQVFDAYQVSNSRIGGCSIYDTGYWGSVEQDFTEPGTYTILLAASAPGNTTLTAYESTYATAVAPTDGTLTTVNTTIIGQEVRITFSGSAGQTISIVSTGSQNFWGSTISLENQTGTVIAAFGVPGFLDATVLPSNGTYQLILDPGPQTGSVGVQIYTVPADVTATASIGGPPVTVTTTVPGQHARVSFSAVAGQVISIVGNTDWNHLIGASVTLLDPQGNYVANFPFQGFYPVGFLSPTTLSSSGTYVLDVDTYASPGPVSLQLYAVPPDATATASTDGTPVTVTTTIPGQNANVTFSGSRGQVISIVASGTQVGSLTLYKSDGSYVASGYYFGGGAFVDAITLPSSDTYKAEFANGIDVGQTTVRIYTVVDASSTAPTDGTPVSVTTTVPGENASVTFTGSANQVVSVFGQFNQPTFASVTLQDSNGNVLRVFTIDDSGEVMSATTLPADGTYTLYVNPEGPSTGTITLRVYIVPQGVGGTLSTDGTPTTVTSTAPDQILSLTFHGMAGQVISILGSLSLSPGESFGDALMTLTDPNGRYVASLFVVNGSNAFLDGTALQTDGTYQISISPFGATTGSYTVQVFTVPADVMGTAMTDGSPTTVTTTVPGQHGDVTFHGDAGQIITFSGATGAGMSASIILRDPNGNYEGSLYTDSTGATLGYSITLGTSGTYTLFIDPGSVPGPSTVNVYTVLPDVTGMTSIGDPPVTLSTTAFGQEAALSFMGSAQQLINITLTVAPPNSTGACFDLTAPDGTYLDSVCADGGDPGFAGHILLPATGTYLLQADGYPNEPSSFTFQVNLQPADLNATAMTDGTPVTVTTTVPSQQAVISFGGTVGQVISVVGMSSLNGTGSAAVTLNAPDGTVLGRWEQSLGGPSLLGTVTLYSAGTYTLSVVPDGTNMGSMTFRVYTDPPAATATASTDGTPTTVNLIPGQSANISFAAMPGQVISVVGSISPSGNGSDNADAKLVAFNGQTLGYFSFGASGGFLDATTLYLGGTYSILFYPNTVMTSLTIQVFTVPADSTTNASTDGTPASVNITVPGQHGSIAFTGSAGEAVSVFGYSGLSNNAPANITLQNPDGSYLSSFTVDSVGEYEDSTVLPSSGTYKLYVDPIAAGTGPVTAQIYGGVSDALATATTDGTPVTVPITTAGQNATISFNCNYHGIANVTGSTALSNGDYALMGIPGSPGYVGHFNATSSGGSMQNVPMEQASACQVRVHPHNASTGSVTVSITLQ